jgi:hypothetical protein
MRAELRLFSELPGRGLLGNWGFGVGHCRKPNPSHYSFLETLYVGVILCAVDRGYARVHGLIANLLASHSGSASG